jgi:hypothetical protein
VFGVLDGFLFNGHDVCSCVGFVMIYIVTVFNVGDAIFGGHGCFSVDTTGQGKRRTKRSSEGEEDGSLCTCARMHFEATVHGKSHVLHYGSWASSSGVLVRRIPVCG